MLDFAVQGEDDYYTWDGSEDADWEIEGVASVENIEEDRFIMYPEGDVFTCEIKSEGGERNPGPVYCW